MSSVIIQDHAVGRGVVSGADHDDLASGVIGVLEDVSSDQIPDARDAGTARVAAESQV
jgi:hypothetical protein